MSRSGLFYSLTREVQNNISLLEKIQTIDLVCMREHVKHALKLRWCYIRSGTLDSRWREHFRDRSCPQSN